MVPGPTSGNFWAATLDGMPVTVNGPAPPVYFFCNPLTSRASSCSRDAFLKLGDAFPLGILFLFLFLFLIYIVLYHLLFSTHALPRLLRLLGRLGIIEREKRERRRDQENGHALLACQITRLEQIRRPTVAFLLTGYWLLATGYLVSCRQGIRQIRIDEATTQYRRRMAVRHVQDFPPGCSPGPRKILTRDSKTVPAR